MTLVAIVTVDGFAYHDRVDVPAAVQESQRDLTAAMGRALGGSAGRAGVFMVTPGGAATLVQGVDPGRRGGWDWTRAWQRSAGSGSDRPERCGPGGSGLDRGGPA